MTALLFPYRVDFVAVIRTKARRKGGQQPFFPLHPTLVLRIRHKRVRKFFPPVSPGGWPTLDPLERFWVAHPFLQLLQKGWHCFPRAPTLSEGRFSLASLLLLLRFRFHRPLDESGPLRRTRSLQRKSDPHPNRGRRYMIPLLDRAQTQIGRSPFKRILEVCDEHPAGESPLRHPGILDRCQDLRFP